MISQKWWLSDTWEFFRVLNSFEQLFRFREGKSEDASWIIASFFFPYLIPVALWCQFGDRWAFLANGFCILQTETLFYYFLSEKRVKLQNSQLVWYENSILLFFFFLNQVKIFSSIKFWFCSAYLVETWGLHRIIQVGRVLRKVSSPVSCSVSAVRSDRVAQGFLLSSLENIKGRRMRKIWQPFVPCYFFTSQN